MCHMEWSSHVGRSLIYQSELFLTYQSLTVVLLDAEKTAI
jgi:hypothetical protein